MTQSSLKFRWLLICCFELTVNVEQVLKRTATYLYSICGIGLTSSACTRQFQLVLGQRFLSRHQKTACCSFSVVDGL